MGLHRTVLGLLAAGGTLLAAMSLPVTALTRTEPVSTTQRPLASLTTEIGRGRVTWQATSMETSVVPGQPMSFHRGFVVATNGTVGLTKSDGSLKRVKPDSAVPLDEGQRVAPRSLSVVPVAFLVVELVDAKEASDPEARTLNLHGGQYKISLWRIQVESGDVDAINGLIQELKAPGLLIVQSGSAPLKLEDAEEAELSDGDAAIVDKTTRVLPDGDDDADLMLATIERTDPPSAKATRTPTTPAQPRGTASSRGGGTLQPTATSTAVPTATATPTPTSTPETSSGSGSGGGFDDSVQIGLPSGGLPCTLLDSDSDGLTECDEHTYGTNPNDADSDDDGLYDNQEIAQGSNPNSSDSDGDGLTDAQEWGASTNPMSADTDDDGCSDGYEISAMGTSPTNGDSDGDGWGDSNEWGRSDPLNSASTPEEVLSDGQPCF